MYYGEESTVVTFFIGLLKRVDFVRVKKFLINIKRNITYFYLISLFLISLVVLFVYFDNSMSFYSIISKINVPVATAIFQLGAIIISFMIFNTSHYSFITHRQYQMWILSITFLISGINEFIFTVNSYNSYSGHGHEYLLYYSQYTQFCLALGLLLSGVFFYKVRKKELNHGIRTALFLAIIVGVFYLLGSYIPSGINSANLDFWWFRNKFVISGGIVFLMMVTALIYIKIFFSTNNKYIINLAAGIFVLMIGHIFRVMVSTYPTFDMLMFDVYKVVSYLLIYQAIFKYNVSMPFEDLVEAQRQIKMYADNLEKIVEVRTAEVNEANGRLISELESAKEIQQSLLPDKFIEMKGTKFVSGYFPCERLSGDFYDIYEVDDDNIGMYVLDVSGHGIKAGLMTMFCNNYVKSKERLIRRYRGLKPHKNLSNFYEEFNKLHFPEEMHMVIFMAVYNAKNRLLKYSSGGMNTNPIVFNREGRIDYLDESQGFPICKLDGFYKPEYKSVSRFLIPGDRVLFYTDGLVDEQKNGIFTNEELENFLRTSVNNTVEEISGFIEFKIMTKKNVLEDDISYFIMEVQ